MQKVKIIVVEDELIIAETLRSMLENLGYQVVDIFTSGIETLKKFEPGMADIVFMDIHLADKTNGIDTAKKLKKITDIPIIFLTNNSNEALRKKAILETKAVHYLSKPFNRTEVATALDFALKLMKDNEAKAPKLAEANYLLKDSIFLKNGLGFKKIMIGDIMLLKADGSYCEFVFKEKSHVFSENLSHFEEKLSFAKEFVRIHRSYIININFVERIHENRVWVNGEEIPIGKGYKSDLTEKIRFI